MDNFILLFLHIDMHTYIHTRMCIYILRVCTQNLQCVCVYIQAHIFFLSQALITLYHSACSHLLLTPTF